MRPDCPLRAHDATAVTRTEPLAHHGRYGRVDQRSQTDIPPHSRNLDDAKRVISMSQRAEMGCGTDHDTTIRRQRRVSRRVHPHRTIGDRADPRCGAPGSARRHRHDQLPDSRHPAKRQAPRVVRSVEAPRGSVPGPCTDDELAAALAAYRTETSTLRFPLDESLPLELIERVVTQLAREQTG